MIESEQRPVGWIGELSNLAARMLAENPDEVRVDSIRMLDPDTVEFLYRQPWDGKLRGLRVTATDIEPDSRLAGRSLDEIAFLLVYVGILEPKADDEFEPPDSNGIWWSTSRDWLLEGG